MQEIKGQTEDKLIATLVLERKQKYEMPELSEACIFSKLDVSGLNSGSTNEFGKGHTLTYSSTGNTERNPGTREDENNSTQSATCV
jgi:hypothetical protein